MYLPTAHLVTLGPPFLFQYAHIPRHWGTTPLMSYPDGERYSCPLQSRAVSLVSTLIFPRTGGVPSHLNSSTHNDTGFLSFYRRTCAPLSHSLCSLSSLLQRTHPSVKLISFLEVAELRILHAAPAVILPRTPLIFHCPARTFCAARCFDDSLSLRPLVQALGSCLAFGAPWSYAMPRSLGRSWVTTTRKSTQKLVADFIVYTRPSFTRTLSIRNLRFFQAVAVKQKSLDSLLSKQKSLNSLLSKQKSLKIGAKSLYS